MKRLLKKLLSVSLCAALIGGTAVSLSSFAPDSGLTASAVDKYGITERSDYFYFDNSKTKWDVVYAYWWNPEWSRTYDLEGNDWGCVYCRRYDGTMGYEPVKFPGIKLTQVSGTDIWQVKIPFGATNLQFSSGKSDEQIRNGEIAYHTGDLEFDPNANAGQIYSIDTSYEPVRGRGVEKTNYRYSYGSWSNYSGRYFSEVVSSSTLTNSEYEYYEDYYGDITITRYNGYQTDISIPSKINGKSVASIGDAAFYNRNILSSVTIPSSVTNIGDNAFWSCDNLSSINIPSGVTSIGNNAFSNCYNLTSITVPYGVKSINDGTFSICTNLTNVNLSYGLTTIGTSAFFNCRSIRSIIIPSSVTSIGESAFLECVSLDSITVPSSVTCIGSNALGYCYDDNWNLQKKYGFIIYGKTGSAAEKYASQNGFKFVDKSASVAVTGMTLNKTSMNLEKGKNVKLTATVSPSNATDKTIKWTTDKSYIASVDSTGLVKANSCGTATITAKTSNGKTATCRVTVFEALKNNSEISAATVTANTMLTLNGKAAGGTAPYKFAYYYKKSTDSTWTKIAGYSTDTSKTFKPTTAGTYTARVNVKDSAGTLVQKDFTVTVKDDALKNNSTVSAASITANTSIAVIGKATGGAAPYTYAYYYKKSTDSSWTKIAGYSTSTMKNFKPAAAGTYTVRVNVKDSTGKLVQKDLTVTAKAELTNKSTVSASSVTANTQVTLNGKAAGGTSPYKYAYYYKKSTDSTWTKIAEYSTDTSKTFKPTTAGTYTVRVNVKDSTGKLVQKDLTVTVKAELTNKSTVSAASVTANKEVALTGKATGGTAPYTYAYYYKKSTDSAWIKIAGYSTDTSKTFEPKEAGTYTARVNVKDSTGKLVQKDFTVTVKAAPLTNNSTVSAETASLDTGITVTAKAAGGTAPYKYAYYYKKTSASNWSVLDKVGNSAYSTNTTANFKPSDQGDYNLRVNIKDSKDNLAQKDFTVKISGWKYVKISGKVYDPDGNVITGATIKLLDKDNTVVASTTSDAAGYSIDFLINETGDYSVKFEYAGYDPVVKSLIEVQEDRVVNAMFANAEQKVYSQYFWLDPAILSQYSSIQMIDEYGIRLDVNEDAIVKKVAAYMYKEGDTWYRSIAFVGENVTKARYMPYLAYNDVIYFDATNAMINVFSLSQDSSGIWSRDGSFGTSKVNISDADGNYLTVYSKNIVGKNCKIFDNKEEMKAWLLAD